LPGKTRSISTGNVPASPDAPRKASVGRILVLKIVLIAFFLLVAFRLIQVQVVDARWYQQIARKQHEAKVELPASRGSVMDRNGRVLVSNTMFVSFGADPKLVGNKKGQIADRFSRVFGKPRETYRTRLASPQKRFVWLERQVDPTSSSRVRASEFEGVIQMNEPKRMYHYDHVAGQVLGLTGIDNNGLSGIELQCDELLKGTKGHVIMQRDGLGRHRPSMDYPRIEPVNGNSVVLTLDLELQAIAEEELRKGVERNKSDAGLVIMMDPATGELLAVAMYPKVNPNRYSAADTFALKNRVVADMYEPGSVFKLVATSIALEEDLVKPEEKFFAENGTYVVPLPGSTTRKITDTHPSGWLTFREAVEQSSNIVFAKVSNRIGAERLFMKARDFGFGTATGVDLPGEVRGDLKKPTEWSGTTLNSMAYGYEVGVTPIQIAAAYGALANYGVLMKPYIVKQIRNEQGEVLSETRPQTIRRVLSKESANLVTQMLEGVVERGTGDGARIEGMKIAGKTGTSRKVVNGKYNVGSYVASFAGFFPADDPRVVCLVMMDNPREGGYTGGLASAPIFREIASKVTATSGRFNKSSEPVHVGRHPVVVPDVANLNVEVAREMLEGRGFNVQTSGKGNTVLAQSPNAGEKLLTDGVINLATDQASAQVPAGFTRVPYLGGLSIRRALNRLTIQHLEAEVAGSGVVDQQYPLAGTLVKTGSSVRIRCTAAGSLLTSAR